MTIGVTGATGGVGSAVVRGLLERGDVEAVVALARRVDAVPARPALAVRRTDYDDQASLRQAFAGLDCLVFVSSDGDAEAMGRHHRHVVAAAADAGLGRIVYTSILDSARLLGFYWTRRFTGGPRRRSPDGHPASVRAHRCSDFFVETWIAPAIESQRTLGSGPLMEIFAVTVPTSPTSPAPRPRSRGGCGGGTGRSARTRPDRVGRSSAETGPTSAHADRRAEYRRAAGARGEPEWLRARVREHVRLVAEGRFAAVSPRLRRRSAARRRTPSSCAGRRLQLSGLRMKTT